MLPVLRSWLPLALVTTILCGLVYVVLQQNIRHSADDAPDVLAEQSMQALLAGEDPHALLPHPSVELSRDDGLFLMILNAHRVLQASSATLFGNPVVPPMGVFDAADADPPHRVTWQPHPAARLAIVVMRMPDGPHPGYVVAGQSLSRSEMRVEQLTAFVVAAWMAALVSSFLAMGLLRERAR